MVSLRENRNASKQRQDCIFHGRQLRCHQGEKSAEGFFFCFGPHRYCLFFYLGVFVYNSYVSFPHSSSAGSECHLAPNFECFDRQVKRQTGLFLRALTTLVKVILERKVPFEHRPYSLVEINCAKKPDEGLRPIALGKSFRLFVSKMCRTSCLWNTSSKMRKLKSRCRH